jgi:hypothetical protein
MIDKCHSFRENALHFTMAQKNALYIFLCLALKPYPILGGDIFCLHMSIDFCV